MAVIGINYSGGNHYDDKLIERPINYKSVYLHTSKKKFNFKSGNFVKDWYDAKKYYIEKLQDKEPYLSGSSSVDHFIMDGAKFDSAYLHVEIDIPILKYVNRENDGWYNNPDLNGWEFFVVEGTKPTWEELRELCGDKKSR